MYFGPKFVFSPNPGNPATVAVQGSSASKGGRWGSWTTPKYCDEGNYVNKVKAWVSLFNKIYDSL